MSFDKAIRHGKEFRKPYTRAKAVDPTCRNHGSCPWCANNRTFKTRKTARLALLDLQAWRRSQG